MLGGTDNRLKNFGGTFHLCSSAYFTMIMANVEDFIMNFVLRALCPWTWSFSCNEIISGCQNYVHSFI